MLFSCQRANAYRDRVAGLEIEVKGIVDAGGVSDLIQEKRESKG